MSDNFVPNFEDRYYEVHPSQLRWAMSQLGAIPGYNVQGYAQGRGGMYIIVVQVPIGAEEQDWRSPAPSRRRVRFDISPRMIGVIVAVALLCAIVGYAAYSGVTVPTWDEVAAAMPQLPAMPWDAPPPAPRGEPVVESSGWHWPWESSVISKPQPAPAPQGFRWPWESAQDSINEGFEQLTNGFMVLGVLVLLAFILWFVGLVRGALGK